MDVFVCSAATALWPFLANDKTPAFERKGLLYMVRVNPSPSLPRREITKSANPLSSLVVRGTCVTALYRPLFYFSPVLSFLRKVDISEIRHPASTTARDESWQKAGQGDDGAGASALEQGEAGAEDEDSPLLFYEYAAPAFGMYVCVLGGGGRRVCVCVPSFHLLLHLPSPCSVYLFFFSSHRCCFRRLPSSSTSSETHQPGSHRRG